MKRFFISFDSAIELSSILRQKVHTKQYTYGRSSFGISQCYNLEWPTLSEATPICLIDIASCKLKVTERHGDEQLVKNYSLPYGELNKTEFKANTPMRLLPLVPVRKPYMCCCHIFMDGCNDER